MSKQSSNNQRIVYLPIGQVHDAPWNPSRRTSKNAVAGLVRSMRESGFWWYMPLVLGRDGLLADGHRRLAAARILKLTEVPCVRVDKAADVLWAEINGRRRTVSRSETLEAVTLGLEVVPEDHSVKVAEFLRVVGIDNAKQSYMIGVSPSILDWARKLARYIGFDGDDEMIGKCVCWLRKHQMQRRARSAMDAEMDPSTIFGYIIGDSPLPKLRLSFE